MSQYPNQPYVGGYPGYPSGGYSYGPDPRGPARRASTLFFIVGGLALLFGACSALVATSAPLDEMLNSPQGKEAREMLERAGISLKTYVAVVSGVMLFWGALCVVLGVV